MPIEIEALEVDGFTTAIAGLDIDYVRTGAESDPCRMTCSGSGDVMLSTGRMGFSAFSHVEVPQGTAVVSLITSTPPGGSWCGVDTAVGMLNVYGPGTPFAGINPAGLSATFLVTSTETIERVADTFGAGILRFSRSVRPLAERPEVRRLTTALHGLTARPELMDDPAQRARLLDLAATAIVADGGSDRARADRRLDSKKIVRDCIDYADSSGSSQPSMSELCRAAFASESRVRHAFVEIFDIPPTQYFQARLLSRLRNELVLADPAISSVTWIASSLGVTQLGRIAGRYRRLFGEVPSETLRRASGRARTKGHGRVRV